MIDIKFKNWFAKRFYKLPEDTVRSLAAQAREMPSYKPDTNPQMLFCWLIKRAAGF